MSDIKYHTLPSIVFVYLKLFQFERFSLIANHLETLGNSQTIPTSMCALLVMKENSNAACVSNNF
jgi:hypothetical protein